MRFDRHPCFDNDALGIVTMGAACRRLSDAATAVPEAYAARVALGDPFNSARRARALALLNNLPAKQQSKIIEAERRHRKDASK